MNQFTYSFIQAQTIQKQIRTTDGERMGKRYKRESNKQAQTLKGQGIKENQTVYNYITVYNQYIVYNTWICIYAYIPCTSA